MSSPESVAYARRLYDSVIDWYMSADLKAQVLLAIDGALLAFLTGSIFRAPTELQNYSASFGPETWLFLALMSVCLFGSIICALYCIRSRLYRRAKLTSMLMARNVDPCNWQSWPPEMTWFFQMVARFKREQFIELLPHVDSDFEVRTLGSQIHILSGNVNRKHISVDIGFLLVVMTLALFLAAALSYLVRVT